MHDATVNRTTDGRGRISSLRWDELKHLDAGRWYGESFAGERVPRVDELLDHYLGRAQLILELKVEAALQPLADLLTRRGIQNHPALRVISFSPNTLRHA